MFGFKRAVTIDHTKCGSSDSSNFAVLVSITDAGLKTVGNSGHVQNSNGYDIQFFSDSSLTTRIPAERESYDASAGTYVGWVKVPTVSHTVDTVIYMAYGDSGISSDPNSDGTYGKTNVWDSNFVEVLHLNETGTVTTWNDSTGVNNGANNGATAGTGKIGGGSSVNGSSTYISVQDHASLKPTAITVTAWVKGTSWANAYNSILHKGNGSTFYEYFVKDNGKIAVYLTAGGIVSVDGNGGVLSTGAWHQVAFTYNSSAGLIVYVNGTQDSTAGANGAIAATDSLDISIGRDSFTAGRYFSGSIDEVKISNVARSADWILTEYNNQNDPSTFLTLGAETSVGGTVYTFTIDVTDTATTFQTTAIKVIKKLAIEVTDTLSSFTDTSIKTISKLSIGVTDTITTFQQAVVSLIKTLSISTTDTLTTFNDANITATYKLPIEPTDTHTTFNNVNIRTNQSTGLIIFGIRI